MLDSFRSIAFLTLMLLVVEPAFAVEGLSSSDMATGSQKLNEFREVKMKIFQTLYNGISPSGWGEEAPKRLFDKIEGKWVRLSDVDLSDAASLEAACRDEWTLFSRVDGYSFSGVTMSKFYDEPRRTEYISRSGSTYAVRNDFRYMSNSSKTPAENKDFLLGMSARSANQEAVLLPLTPNILLEVRVEGGFPELLGRCE
ncbi:hypothetical protein C5748_22835 [Phyllobacterium phragmitis]|uniref:Uncharacterized protein n=1 Tax=Phyllobacterium phragmitis TaxID=2670329 RepID=A0A2S9IKZ0_9HYPH|nr:hypothetical protein [Phyllobacterium phragmitis]PRD41197.1 hypothetical protein C5748_22835 [Phyllobacterium phragmitis]